VTVAPEITAPEASVTVPVILALMSCPCAKVQTRNMKKVLNAMRALTGGLQFHFFLKAFANRFKGL
jgi:hypothetical protein